MTHELPAPNADDPCSPRFSHHLAFPSPPPPPPPHCTQTSKKVDPDSTPPLLLPYQLTLTLKCPDSDSAESRAMSQNPPAGSWPSDRWQLRRRPAVAPSGSRSHHRRPATVHRRPIHRRPMLAHRWFTVHRPPLPSACPLLASWLATLAGSLAQHELARTGVDWTGLARTAAGRWRRWRWRRR